MTAVLALALAGLGAWTWLGRTGTGASPQLTFVQKTFRRQSIFNARFLPDGKTVVYSSSHEGSVPQLFIVRLEYPEPQPLGLEDTQLLSISSKGELAVLSHAHWLNHRLFEGMLGRVPLGSSAPRDLMDHVREADWSPDRSELAIIHTIGGTDGLEFPIGKILYRASGYLSDPRVSPDGRLVAFMEHRTRFDDRGSVDVVDRSGKRTVLASGYWGLNATVQDVSRDGRWLFTRDDISTRAMLRASGTKKARIFPGCSFRSFLFLPRWKLAGPVGPGRNRGSQLRDPPHQDRQPIVCPIG